MTKLATSYGTITSWALLGQCKQPECTCVLAYERRLEISAEALIQALYIMMFFPLLVAIGVIVLIRPEGVLL